MAYVPVPKDLSKVKTKVALNLTKRQIICFAAALILGLPLTAFIRITKIVFLQRETIVYQVPDVRAIWHTQNINMILI